MRCKRRSKKRSKRRRRRRSKMTQKYETHHYDLYGPKQYITRFTLPVNIA